MSFRKAPHYFLNVTAPVFVLIIVLFFSAWVRFDGITQQGIDRGDSYGYLKEAKLWADWQTPGFYKGKFYRPVSYFLQGMAIRVFGYNDYSIKLLHGIMGMISIALVFLIAFLLAGDYWVGVACSLLYAFLPAVVRFTRSELLHVESTFFVLSALFFFILFARREAGTGKGKRVTFFLLFLSGLCSGLAANTHPDLAFLAPGYVLYLFISSVDLQNKKESLKQSLILVSIFTFSFFTPYLLGFLLFGTEKVLQVFFKETSIARYTPTVGRHGPGKLTIFLDIFYRPVKFYFGSQFFLTGLLLAGSTAIAIYRGIKRKRDPFFLYLPLILIFSYASFFALFMNKIAKNRVLMPLLPLFIFFIFLWYHKIGKEIFGGFAAAVFVCLFFTLFLLNPKTLPGKTTYKNETRLIYNILKDNVNQENKLLIAPVPMFYYCRDYQCDLYFGKNAVYLINLPIEDTYNPASLNELLENRNIRFIFLGENIRHALLNLHLNLSKAKCFRQWFRNEKFHYSLEKDLEIIQSYIRRKNGVLIHKSGLGKIYYLTGEEPAQNKNNLIANGSFEHWWQGLPLGGWLLLNGTVSVSREAAHGSFSMSLEPNSEKETRIIWTYPDAPGIPGKGLKLRARLDVKAGEPGNFFFYFRAKINGNWERLKPGILGHPGNGEWVTFSEDIEPVNGMCCLTLDIWLRGGSKEPAFIDNISITAVE